MGMLKFILFVIILCICSNVYANPIEYWNTNIFKFSATRNTVIKVVDQFRYRNGIKVNLPPIYVDNEFFYNIKPDDEFIENRFSVGIESKFFFNSKLSLFYMLRSKKYDSWKNSNIIGLALKFSF